MKYSVKDRLDIFEFHDSEFSLVEFEQDKLVISIKHLNIHENADENPHDCDMELGVAKMTFDKFEVISYEPMRKYQVDDEGNWFTDEPQIIHKGEEAKKVFKDRIAYPTSVYSVDISAEDNKTFITLETSAPNYFTAIVSFEGVTVEWYEYAQKAWYELHKQYHHAGRLITPNGEIETEIHIILHEEDVYFKGELEKAPVVDVGIKYEDDQIYGHGRCYTWEDAFADLQKKLPSGVILKCCITCRHGNMCPFGNEPGILFCTKGLTINTKADMCDLFSDDKIWEKRKSASDFCDEYEMQSEQHYTYSDFLYYLNSNN